MRATVKNSKCQRMSIATLGSGTQSSFTIDVETCGYKSPQLPRVILLLSMSERQQNRLHHRWSPSLVFDLLHRESTNTISNRTVSAAHPSYSKVSPLCSEDTRTDHAIRNRLSNHAYSFFVDQDLCWFIAVFADAILVECSRVCVGR